MNRNQTKEKLLEISKSTYDNQKGYVVKKYGFLDGVIMYYETWKKHVFHPFLLNTFTTDELTELIEFLNHLDGINVNVSSSLKYVEFQEWFETDPKGKWYTVLSKENKEKRKGLISDKTRELGQIIPSDNGYYFRSEAEDAIYNAQCLEDISDFIKEKERAPKA